MNPKYDLVVMDWGIGGLSVYREIVRLIPEISILYYSDSGQKPYGKMSARELQHRLLELISYFSTLGIRHFVIACNAASTTLPALKTEFKKKDLKVIGVIDCGVELVNSTSYKNIGIIGGRRTILSRIYTKRLSTKKRKIVGRIAQPLSALIEKGELETPHTTAVLKQILSPLKNCDAVLLACTHYPAVSEQIQSFLPGCKLLDPALTTAVYVRDKWKLNPYGKRNSLFMTSGNPNEMKKSVFAAFQFKINLIFTWSNRSKHLN